MFPMDRSYPPLIVEYDCRGKRESKTFTDVFESRRFYVAMFKAGRNPSVRKLEESKR